MKKLSKNQFAVITALLEDSNRWVHGSPFYNSIHVTDGKRDGFRLSMWRATLNSLVKMNYLIFEKDYKYTLNRDLVS
jgi:hypothetical protein